MSSRPFSALFHRLFAVAIGALAAACTAAIDQRGNLPDSYALAELEPGKATRQDVARELGSPSSVAAFGDETWYYIASRTERFAFYRPKVVDQQVVAIAFDKSGLIKSVEHYGLDDSREIDPVGRVTPTSGKKLTIIQQLVENVGRFAGASTGQQR
ncbi:MAG: outer membrane protein assembly factor BamE [Alphaproteobacteria bacterium]